MQKHVGFVPKHPQRQGDRVGSGSKISGEAGAGEACASRPLSSTPSNTSRAMKLSLAKKAGASLGHNEAPPLDEQQELQL